jgi:hypothetical protein
MKLPQPPGVHYHPPGGYQSHPGAGCVSTPEAICACWQALCCGVGHTCGRDIIEAGSTCGTGGGVGIWKVGPDGGWYIRGTDTLIGGSSASAAAAAALYRAW